MTTLVHCWKCDHANTNVILPLSRREECEACQAELHVCRQCKHFAPHTSSQCTEDRAEPPNDKTRANFCDYFSLETNPRQDDKSEQESALSQLNALFGEGEEEPTEPKPNPLDDLFK